MFNVIVEIDKPAMRARQFRRVEQYARRFAGFNVGFVRYFRRPFYSKTEMIVRHADLSCERIVAETVNGLPERIGRRTYLS